MMKCLVAVLLLLASLLVSSVQGKAKMKKYIWLQELKPCVTEPGQAQINGSFKYTGQGTFYTNLDAYTPHQIDHLFFFVSLKKCPTKLMTEDCEDMMAFPLGDQCLPDGYFRYLYDQFRPPVICPAKGFFQAKNVVIEMDNHWSFFQALGEEEWLHVYIDIYNDEKKQTKVGCVIVIATTKKVRVQDKNNRNRKQ